MSAIMLKAHFDGEKVVLDEPANLQPDTKLIVTVLEIAEKNGASDKIEEERGEWEKLSINGLEYAYSKDEPVYSIDLIRAPNPEYEGR